MASTLVLGSTGFVGSHILSVLQTASPKHISSIDIIARRSPPSATESTVIYRETIEKDVSTWAKLASNLSPAPKIVFSSLATTRANAGSFEKQYALEHDVNIEVAKAAKEAGAKTYVCISSAGANANAFFGYTKMKGEIEEHIKEIGFDHTIIVRPGLIAGSRPETRYAEGLLRFVAAGAGRISNSFKDFWAQDADIIAKAAVKAALMVESGEVKEKVWLLDQKEIVRLGRTEWKDIST